MRGLQEAEDRMRSCRVSPRKENPKLAKEGGWASIPTLLRGRQGRPQTPHLEGTWYVIMTCWSALAMSSQMGSWSTYLMTWSPGSARAWAAPASASEESMLPKYLLVWLL